MGQWIKQRRKEIHISQEELSERLQIRGFDVARATVSHWEMDKYLPPINDPAFAIGLADSLELGLMDMLIRAGFELRFDDKDAVMGAEIIHRLEPRMKKTAIHLLETLLREN